MQDRPCLDVPIAWTAFGERVGRRSRALLCRQAQRRESRLDVTAAGSPRIGPWCRIPPVEGVDCVDVALVQAITIPRPRPHNKLAMPENGAASGGTGPARICEAGLQPPCAGSRLLERAPGHGTQTVKPQRSPSGSPWRTASAGLAPRRSPALSANCGDRERQTLRVGCPSRSCGRMISSGADRVFPPVRTASSWLCCDRSRDVLRKFGRDDATARSGRLAHSALDQSPMSYPDQGPRGPTTFRRGVVRRVGA
jgi:hypothetical protein